MHITILLISLMASLTASAATYKWVDEHGVTQYGDTIPPQAVSRGMTQMDNKGQVIKKVDAALTPEQINAQQAELAKQKELNKQSEERRRHDQALIGTYTSEQEIDLARDRNTQQIDGTVRSAQERIVASQARAKELAKQQKNYQEKDKSGNARMPPRELLEEIEQTKKEQLVLNAAIDELQKQKALVGARFNEDKMRFREIKAGSTSSASTSIRDSKSDRTYSSIPFVINDSTRTVVNECIARWSDSPANAKNYAASGELVQSNNKTELVLDGRLQGKTGQFTPQRIVCPLTVDGKVDTQGVAIKKALASLGARY